MTKCCFYGSLRKPMYNYTNFHEVFKEGFHYLRTTTIKGYYLYDLGPFPAAVASKSTMSEVEMIVDLFEVSDECYDRIRQMEVGCGYYEDLINIDDAFYVIFLQDAHHVKSNSRVQSGDWVKYENGFQSKNY